MTDNWLQKFKDLSEKKSDGQNRPTEAQAQAQKEGHEHNEDLKRQQLQHRRAAFENDTPRNIQVSGTIGRIELYEKDADGKIHTHIKGINPPGATTDNSQQSSKNEGNQKDDSEKPIASHKAPDFLASEPGERKILHGGENSHRDVISEHNKPSERKLVDLGGGAKAEEITPANCSEKTKKLWETMCSPDYKNAPYNCFCAVLEYVQPGNVPSPNHVPGELRFILKVHGWKEHKEMDLDSGGHKAGEVVMITDANKHSHAAIVSKVENGHIVELEQKPNDTDPPVKTSLKQFKELFKPAHAEIYQKDN